MKQINTIGLLALLTCCQVSVFANANSTIGLEVDGEVRLGFVSQNHDAGLDNKNAALGGSIGIKTKPVNGIQVGAKFYTTQRFKNKSGSGSGTGLFASDDEQYTILGEAYVRGELQNTNLTIGRQRLDTPYANDNDVRMVPNLFEAIRLSNSDIPDTKLLAIHVTRTAGVDSSVPEQFTKLVAGHDGVTILGLEYEGITNSKLSAWYNNIDGLTSIAHVEGYNSIIFNENNSLDLGVQFIDYQEKANSGSDGSVYGVCANYKTNNLSLYAGYNKASNDTGKAVNNVFGGGRPYMTSMDTLTLNGLSEVEAYRLGLGYDLLSNLNASYYYANFDYDPAKNSNFVEQNLYVTYKASDSLSAVLIYTDTEHEVLNVVQGDSYKRIRGTIKFVF